MPAGQDGLGQFPASLGLAAGQQHGQHGVRHHCPLVGAEHVIDDPEGPESGEFPVHRDHQVEGTGLVVCHGQRFGTHGPGAEVDGLAREERPAGVEQLRTVVGGDRLQTRQGLAEVPAGNGQCRGLDTEHGGGLFRGSADHGFGAVQVSHHGPCL
ncbi:hypothetical protein ACFFX0_26815 [Citricoccus parietis]|uniref:Uncharacterized protein n=1 Tax=Citricoccus parietis TaxID=592307 RepID=A0ABV5G6M9_9MICC